MFKEFLICTLKAPHCLAACYNAYRTNKVLRHVKSISYLTITGKWYTVHVSPWCVVEIKLLWKGGNYRNVVLKYSLYATGWAIHQFQSHLI